MNNPAAILGLMGIAAQGIDFDNLVYREPSHQGPRPEGRQGRRKRNKKNRIAKQSRKRNR